VARAPARRAAFTLLEHSRIDSNHQPSSAHDAPEKLAPQPDESWRMTNENVEYICRFGKC